MSRGRGVGSACKSKGEAKPSRNVKTIDDLSSYLYSLSLSNIDVYGNEFADMVLGFATDVDDNKLEEVVDLIFETTIEDKEHSELGAEVCRQIMKKDDPKCVVLLEKLSKAFQGHVKQMKEIRRVSIEKWLGVFSFLCEIFGRIRVAGAPIKVLGLGIVKLIVQMLTDRDTIDDEIDCICSKLKSCGHLLSTEFPDKIENIFMEFRKQVISKESSSIRRCYILEIIEFRQMGWSDPSKLLDKFYPDAIADAVAADESGVV